MYSQTREYWGKVRKVWADYIATHDTISLKNKIDNKFLHEYLIDLAKEYAAKKVNDAGIDGRIKTEIARFIGRDQQGSGGTN